MQLPDATIDGAGAVFALSHKVNASFQIVNEALRLGLDVWTLGFLSREEGDAPTREAIEKFTRRAAAGEFAKAPHAPRKNKGEGQ